MRLRLPVCLLLLDALLVLLFAYAVKLKEGAAQR
jgi:hypothetical protein